MGQWYIIDEEKIINECEKIFRKNDDALKRVMLLLEALKHDPFNLPAKFRPTNGIYEYTDDDGVKVYHVKITKKSRLRYKVYQGKILVIINDAEVMFDGKIRVHKILKEHPGNGSRTRRK